MRQKAEKTGRIHVAAAVVQEPLVILSFGNTGWYGMTRRSRERRETKKEPPKGPRGSSRERQVGVLVKVGGPDHEKGEDRG